MSVRATVVRCVVFVGAAMVWGHLPSLSAAEADGATLSRRQDEQQRAREMTRGLLEGVLQVQLRQLEENGLTEMPIYRDIELMRDHLQEIVDDEMPKVVELLSAAETAPESQRSSTFVAARQMIRGIVLQLSTERQSLLRRLKAAELGEQVARLITAQQGVHDHTRLLREGSREQQAEGQLKAHEDQRDVQDFFVHLIATLDDVRTWGGPISQTAVDGLRLLKAQDVGRHLDEAEQALADTRLDGASDHQTRVLNSLNDLMRLLRREEQGAAAEETVALDRVRALINQQSEVREQTRQLTDGESASAELVEQQLNLTKSIEAFDKSRPAMVAIDQLMNQAREGSKKAADALFEGNNAQAIAAQTEALGSLTAIEELLGGTGENPPSDQSAEQLAAQAERLKAAQDKLQQIGQRQKQIAEQLSDKRTEVAAEQADLADQLHQLQEQSELPPVVSAALAEAHESSELSGNLLADAGKDETTIKPAIESAERALERALATVAAEREATERKAAAVKIGELARAADTLERAAAEERAIVAAAATLANEPTSSDRGEQASRLAQRQSDVRAIAENVADGLKTVSPASSERAKAASHSAKTAGEQLREAAVPGREEQSLQKALEDGSSTTQRLTEAATQLRQEVARAAEALAQASAQRADQLARQRTRLEESLTSSDDTTGKALDQIEEAQAAVQKAMTQQQKASGQIAAAKQAELTDRLRDLLKQASSADDTPRSEKGTAPAADSEALAAQARQLVAEAQENRESLAGKATPETLSHLDAQAAALEQAANAAATPAKNSTASSPETPKSPPSKDIVPALKAALAAAEVAGEALAQQPPEGNADAAAQQKASQLASEAAEQSRSVVPQASQALSEAAAKGQEAAQRLSDSPPDAKNDQVQTAQSQAMNGLKSAQKQLQQARDAILGQQQQQRQDLQARLRQQVTPTAMVDPAAAEAVSAAERALTPAADADRPRAQDESPLPQAQRYLTRATESLSTREQEVRRDEALARQLAELARQQQQAAQALSAQRQAMDAQSAKTTPETAKQAATSARQFSDAQVAMGRGATELSGQEQVANPQLRAALELAARLLSAEMAASTMADAAQSAPPLPTPGVDPSTGSSPQQTATGSSSDAQQAAGQSPSSRGPTGSDTGFVPQMPALTAQMMAGPELAEAMQQASRDEATPGQAQGNQASNQQAQAGKTAQGVAQSTASDSATGSMDNPADNVGFQDQALQKDRRNGQPQGQAATSREGDATVVPRQLQDPAWLMKLPPEARASLRGGSQQKAPKAYEERLRRYYQSVD